MVDRDKGDKSYVRITMRPTTTCAECGTRERRDGVTGRDRAQDRQEAEARMASAENAKAAEAFARNRERLRAERLAREAGEATASGAEVKAIA